jgi:hypothetical protein
MIDFISKTAGILSTINTPAAKQASAALDGVIKAYAARRHTVMTGDEVAAFNEKLKAFLDDALGGSKIPRGLKWRLLKLKEGQAAVERQLARLEDQKARGQVGLVEAEPAGEDTPVEIPQSELHAKPWGDIVDDAEREKAARTPAPVDLPPLSRKESPAPISFDEAPGAPQLARKETPAPIVFEDQIDTPTAPVMKKQPPVKVLGPDDVSEKLNNPEAPPDKYAPKGTSAAENLPQGTHAETWDEKLRRWMGLESKSELLTDLVKVADKLDASGFSEAADIIENIITAAAERAPSLNETRKDLYDSKENNKSTMRDFVKSEIEKNTLPSHIESHRGVAVSQTRYSPDMPGVMMKRVSDGVYQCLMTNKVYDFQHGFVDASGTQRSGGSVKHQTPQFSQYTPPSRIFEDSSKLSKRK